MLRLLRIRNFAIIDELELELGPGFNAITGETGAGKSIILDAIGLILGGRASADLIRTGFDEATVEALFDIGSNETLVSKLAALGLDAGRDQELIIKRTIHRSGKNKIFFNGELVTLSQLGELCESLVELCSQHEHQSLAKPAYQLDLLDRYGGLLELRREIRELYSALSSCKAELRMLVGHDQEAVRTEDFLRFQLSEIDEFAPKEAEEELLQAERRRLVNATQLIEHINQVLELLGGSHTEDTGAGDARALLGKALQRLTKALVLDTSLHPISETLSRALMELDETVSLLGSYAADLETNPTELATAEERLERYHDMKRKYGANYGEILATRNRIASELEEYASRQDKVLKLQERLENIKEVYSKNARLLSKKRESIAKVLRTSICQELSELMMPETRFEIQFEKIEEGPAGTDRIQFMFSPNPGEEPKPVGKIASGGELSRVMLAIRRTIADRGSIGVYLFDEVDAGIGGQTASVVGRKLQSVAEYNQVICITHLPQVAAFAKTHYLVSKKTVDKRTFSRIDQLSGPKRVDELARMLGGMNVTEKSRAHAKDLLEQAVPLASA